MKTVNKSVLIWYSPEEMFNLVTGWISAPVSSPGVTERACWRGTMGNMLAEVGISLSGIRQTFVTRNLHDPGRRVQMKLVRGFSRLDGDWHFAWSGRWQPARFQVELQLNYGFDSAPLAAALVGPVFDRIAGSMVDAFVKRAEQVYG